MEKRIFGIILTLMGIGGLIYAAVQFSTNKGYRPILVFGILGALFFFAGFSLIRSTKDVINKNEKIS